MKKLLLILILFFAVGLQAQHQITTFANTAQIDTIRDFQKLRVTVLDSTFFQKYVEFARSVTVDTNLTANNTINKILFNRVTRVYAMGNSLTNAGVFESFLQSLLGNSWNVVNLGIGGQTTSQMVQRFNTEVVVPADGAYCIVLGGINDIVSAGSSALTVEANLQTMYTLAHNASIKVIAMTILPFAGNVNWTSALQSKLDSVNIWIKTTAINVDYTVDNYSFMADPLRATFLKPSYSSSDSLHPNTVGYDTMGANIYRGVTWVVTSSTPTVSVSGSSIALNQDLLKTSTPKFSGVNLEWFALNTPNVFPDARFQIVQDTTKDLFAGSSALLIDRYYNGGVTGPTLTFRRARGTASSPSAILSADILGLVGGLGYGTSQWLSSSAYLYFVAGENFSNSNAGGYARIATTGLGTVSATSKFQFGTAGVFQIDPSGSNLTTDVGANAWFLIQGGRTLTPNIRIWNASKATGWLVDSAFRTTIGLGTAASTTQFRINNALLTNGIEVYNSRNILISIPADSSGGATYKSTVTIKPSALASKLSLFSFTPSSSTLGLVGDSLLQIGQGIGSQTGVMYEQNNINNAANFFTGVNSRNSTVWGIDSTGLWLGSINGTVNGWSRYSPHIYQTNIGDTLFYRNAAGDTLSGKGLANFMGTTYFKGNSIHDGTVQANGAVSVANTVTVSGALTANNFNGDTAWTTIRRTATDTTSAVIAAGMYKIGGLAFSMVANGVYEIRAVLIYGNVAATTTGFGVGFIGPTASVAAISVSIPLAVDGASAMWSGFLNGAVDSTIATSTPVISQYFAARIAGNIYNSSNAGTFYLTWRPEVAASVTLRQDSWMEYRRVR
jgi:lysophospholipase L1-like esterase